ncbi:Uma2 family endonuclease [Agilicoccus flavus]|uniref:Uma2 family endonuclease n=1 Tax=Agilicoccus flavus TaxID=2775968 RepID=UPI001CF6A0A6|nr:Uma2 family endonuclease [Agilicoccus flavus]
MSLVAGSWLPSRIDLEMWDEYAGLHDDAFELVEGVPTMSPPGEGPVNRGAGMMLALAINRDRGEWLAVEELDVTLWEVPRPTVRRPDVVVAPAAALRRGAQPPQIRRVRADQALFIAEVVSESSVERDHVAKRRDYALAGIASYLVVDLRSDPGELWLYEERDADGLFVEVAPRERVVLAVAGVTIPLSLDDLEP